MISIIIPIYKAEAYLEECLTSIQKQTYSYFEAICVNDGSPDNSEAICQKFVEIDPRFKLVNQRNSGVSSARNTGLANAKGDFICFVDADDRIDFNYLEHLLSLREDGVLPICSHTSIITDLGKCGRIKTYDAKDFIRHIFKEDIPHPNLWAMLFDAKVINKNSIEFVVGCIKNEDTEFFVKYIACINKVIVSKYNGYFYRLNPNSCMNAKIDMRSLTSIEAQERMARYLIERRIIEDADIILGASIQVYIYSTAKGRNRDLYNYIHDRYDVLFYMKKMLKHPRITRKGVSVCYLLLGKELFYRLFAR